MIKKATPNDARILAELAIQMWSNHTVSELNTDFAEIINSNDAVCLIKYVDDMPVGFAQCQLRHDYVRVHTHLPSVIWKEYLLFPNISIKDMQKNCCTNANYGQKKRDVQNLQVTVNLTTPIALISIWQWVLKKQTVLYVLGKS